MDIPTTHNPYNTPSRYPTWAELSEMNPGTIVVDFYTCGVRHLIVRGKHCLNAYFGIPDQHPLAGLSADFLHLDCYGDLVAYQGDDKQWPAGYYWYGWSYNQMNDLEFGDTKQYKDGKIVWGVSSVLTHMREVFPGFKYQMMLAEMVAKKYQPQP